MPRPKPKLPPKLGEPVTRRRKPVMAPVISAAQFRAARALLGWSQQQMADELGVHRRSIAGWELGTQRCSGEFCQGVLAAFFEIGIVFPGGGYGIGGKFAGEGKYEPKGDCVALRDIGERWVREEVDED